MGVFEDLARDFFDRYEEPKIEQLTVVFSDIDPPLQQVEPNRDHELLENLLDGGFADTSDDEYFDNEDNWADGGDTNS